MRRLQVALLAVLACALVAVPAAHAAKVKTKAVAQDKAAVERFWTAERMRNAKPADETLAGKPPAQTRAKPPKAAATPLPLPYTTAPTRTNGKVFFSDGGANYVCSGTAVLSANRSTVWTAGHCVHDGAGGFHTNWAFVPAYVDGSRPYGTWAARRLVTTDGWASAGDFSYDLGAANVAPVGGRSLTDVVGGRSVLFNTSRSQQYAAHGYPAGSPFNGQRLWVCNSGLTYNDTSANPATMGISCDMTGGSSGGGWIAGGGVTSVNSYGYSTLRNVMFGPYQGSVAQSLYTQAGSG